MEFVDLKEQFRRYRPEIEARMARVLEHGRFIMGPEVGELEGRLAEMLGVRHAIAVASGTHSLEIALRALGVGPGDEVVTVPFTWISTAEAVALVGARPVFVDIDPLDFNIDVSRIEAAIGPRTKVLLPVSLFGQMPDFEAINAIAEARGLAVIEDAAQSLGATRGGRPSGAAALIGSTSFFPAKPLGCYGDGGALFTDDDGLAERMRAIRNHGGIVRDDHRLLGMNGRLDTLQAAVLLAKLPHFAEELAARARIARRYDELLGGLCEIPAVRPGNTHVYAQYTVRVPGRDGVAARMRAAGVPTAVYYPQGLHEQPVFAGLAYRRGDFPCAERACGEVLSLPMHPFLDEAAQDFVVETFRRCLP